MKTVDFLDAVKARHNLPSDYALAKFMGLTQSQISRYRNKPEYFGDAVALKVAELLELPADYVLACAHAERATDSEISKVWTGMADKLKKTSATTAALAFAILFTGDPDGGAMAANSNTQRTMMTESPALYIMSTLKRWFGRAMAGLFGGSHAPNIAHA